MSVSSSSMDQENYEMNSSVDLRNMLHDVLNSDASSMVDFTFKVHKIVISACSLEYKCIKNDILKKHSMQYMKGTHHQEMETIIKAIYSGVAKFYQEKMNEFLKAVENLKINDSNDKDDTNIIKDELDSNEPGEEKILESEIVHGGKSASSTNNESSVHRKFSCDKCDTHFKRKWNLKKRGH